jgi:hypothetical protein
MDALSEEERANYNKCRLVRIYPVLMVRQRMARHGPSVRELWEAVSAS